MMQMDAGASSNGGGGEIAGWLRGRLMGARVSGVRGGGAMLGRVSSAVQQLLKPGPEARELDRDGTSGSGGGRHGRKRPRPSGPGCEEQEGRGWKRLKMAGLVDTVMTTAQGVWRTTALLLNWLRSQSPSLGHPLTPAHSPPSFPNRSRRSPLSAPGPTQDVACFGDDSFLSSSGDQDWTLLATPARARPHRPEHLLSSGDVGWVKRTLNSPRAQQTVNGYSRGDLAPPRHQERSHLHQSTCRALRTPSPSLIAQYNRTVHSRVPQNPLPESHSAGHLKGHRRPTRKYYSTVEETIHREEKEIYRQLLEMMTTGYSSKPVSSPLSHRELSRIHSPKEWTSPKVLQSLEENELASETMEPELPSCRMSWNDLSDLLEGTESTCSNSPAMLEGTPNTDTVSTGSDSESVIVVKVKEAPRRAIERMPKFDAVLWIRELTSMYDSRARERRRLIEEQEALAERLRNQRLQEKEMLSEGASSQLHLTVPLVEEIPIADIPHRELDKGEHRITVLGEEEEEEEEEQFPELTEEMQDEVYRAFRPGNPDEVLSEGFRLTITRKDIHTLSHLNWLNDEVINFYMNLLVERSKSASLPTLHAFNTFFYPKVKSDGYQAVKRWTKKVDIFARDLLLVPVHLGVHWCLAVVDFRRRTISYYDSMGGSNDEACRILLHYLKEESRDKRKVELDISGWVLGSKRSQDIPQQMNGSDCGMFTCKYADYISRDRPIRFSQKDMPYFRQLVAWEILHQILL